MQEITDLLMDGSFTEEDDQELEEELRQLTADQITETLPAVPSGEIEADIEPEPGSKEAPVPTKKSASKKQAVEAN